MNLKKIGKVLTSKSVGNWSSSYEKRIYRAAVSQRFRNTDLDAPVYQIYFTLERHPTCFGRSFRPSSEVQDSICLTNACCLCRRICCHNTDHVHVNGHDRTITVILAKYSLRLPDDGSFVIRNMLEHF